MNKLKDKVFLVIFGLLTLFLITILFIFNSQDYYTKKQNILRNLTQAKKAGGITDELSYNLDGRRNAGFNNKPSMIFMDYAVYTVILDSQNNIICIINNSGLDKNDNEILTITNKIISKNNSSKVNVPNLYFNKYAYSYNYGESITIINIENIKSELLSRLKISILIFIILEALIIFISKKITNWIITPVLDSFERQKQFIAHASHELKTPLAVIMASSDALYNNPKEKKWLNNIKSESDRMNNLIKNLLTLAKLEDDNKDIIKSNLNLSKLVLLQSLTYESLMFEQNLKLETLIDDDIHFKCNEEEIKELLSILIDNAIKHSFKNESIKVSLKESKNSVILKVENKGKEIPKGEEEKIFERFYRLDKSRNRNENRYGLGLAIAKKIAQNNNANITARSEDNLTTFEIVFKKNS